VPTPCFDSYRNDIKQYKDIGANTMTMYQNPNQGSPGGDGWFPGLFDQTSIELTQAANRLNQLE